MSDGTSIEWADATQNYVNGCSVVSPGCTNCYAMRLAGTRMKHHPTRAGLTQDSKAGPVWTGDVRLHEPALLAPLKWKRPRRIFWNAHGDLFHENVPDAAIDRLFAVAALTPQHQHLILTKRSARMREYVGRIGVVGHNRSYPGHAVLAAMDGLSRDKWPDLCWPLPNVWLGVSVEDQARADERREDFRATPAAIKFVSYEPALGPVDWSGWEFVNQIIGGGESGLRARPCHPQWQRDTRDWCASNGIAYFFKQWGEHLLARERHLHGFHPGHFVDHLDSGGGFIKVGKKRAGRLLDGREHNESPA